MRRAKISAIRSSVELITRKRDGFELTREDCESIVMQARLKAGWITEADLVKPAAEEETEEEAEPAQA